MNVLTEAEIIAAAKALDAAYQDMANADRERELSHGMSTRAEKHHARAKDAYLVARAALVRRCVTPPLDPISAKATALAAHPAICAEP